MTQDYFETARENEVVFRHILRDLRDHRDERPMGAYGPEDLDTEASLDEIFQKYSQGNRYGKFTITNFSRLKETVTISFQDIASLSGGGAELEYIVSEDSSVKYQKPVSTMMS